MNQEQLHRVRILGGASQAEICTTVAYTPHASHDRLCCVLLALNCAYAGRPSSSWPTCGWTKLTVVSPLLRVFMQVVGCVP